MNTTRTAAKVVNDVTFGRLTLEPGGTWLQWTEERSPRVIGHGNTREEAVRDAELRCLVDDSE